jgi:DNA-binding PadR family transcriptional regulator
MKKKDNGGNTANALLGLLTLSPMSGYDIRALTERSIGHFWSESYGQIYPALRLMEKQGLVEKKTKQSAGRPEKNVFNLTREGRERLKSWLDLPPIPEVPRSELLLKLFFGHHAPEGANRRHIESLRSAHQEALKTYTVMEQRLKKEEPDDPQLPYWLMTLSFGRHRSASFVAWANESLKQIDALEKSGRQKKAIKK